MRTKEEIGQRFEALNNIGFAYNVIARHCDIPTKTVLRFIRQANYNPSYSSLERANRGINNIMQMITSELK